MLSESHQMHRDCKDNPVPTVAGSLRAGHTKIVGEESGEIKHYRKERATGYPKKCEQV